MSISTSSIYEFPTHPSNNEEDVEFDKKSSSSTTAIATTTKTKEDEYTGTIYQKLGRNSDVIFYFNRSKLSNNGTGMLQDEKHNIRTNKMPENDADYLHKLFLAKDFSAIQQFFDRDDITEEKKQIALLRQQAKPNDWADGTSILHTISRWEKPYETLNLCLPSWKSYFSIAGKELVMLKGNYEQSVLHHLCRQDLPCLEFISYILDIGGKDITMIQDEDGYTALHDLSCCASSSINLEVMKMMVEVGGQNLLTVQNEFGSTALHCHCDCLPNLDMVKLMTEVGGLDMLMLQNNSGNTALHCLCDTASPSLELVKLMVEVGGLKLVMSRNGVGATTFQHHCFKNSSPSTDLLRYLIDVGGLELLKCRNKADAKVSKQVIKMGGEAIIAGNEYSFLSVIFPNVPKFRVECANTFVEALIEVNNQKNKANIETLQSKFDTKTDRLIKQASKDKESLLKKVTELNSKIDDEKKKFNDQITSMQAKIDCLEQQGEDRMLNIEQLKDRVDEEEKKFEELLFKNEKLEMENEELRVKIAEFEAIKKQTKLSKRKQNSANLSDESEAVYHKKRSTQQNHKNKDHTCSYSPLSLSSPPACRPPIPSKPVNSEAKRSNNSSAVTSSYSSNVISPTPDDFHKVAALQSKLKRALDDLVIEKAKHSETIQELQSLRDEVWSLDNERM